MLSKYYCDICDEQIESVWYPTTGSFGALVGFLVYHNIRSYHMNCFLVIAEEITNTLPEKKK